MRKSTTTASLVQPFAMAFNPNSYYQKSFELNRAPHPPCWRKSPEAGRKRAGKTINIAERQYLTHKAISEFQWRAIAGEFAQRHKAPSRKTNLKYFYAFRNYVSITNIKDVCQTLSLAVLKPLIPFLVCNCTIFIVWQKE